MVRSKKSLAEIGEVGFLRRLLPSLRQTPGVIVGPGDDCAVVRSGAQTLLTTDALVEGVHFRRDWLTAEQIGAKSMLVNLSDIAAMGGRPRFALMSVSAPPSLRRDELWRLHRGAARAARAAGVAIVGGNLSAAEQLVVSVTLVGEARRPVLRRGAKPGDALFVTGTLGDAAAAVQMLELGLRRTERGRAARDDAFVLRRFAAPTPRLETGRRLAETRLAAAMIDVSDGLVRDLGHICAASSVGAVVEPDRVPRSRAYDRLLGPDIAPALAGGEDYELLFTVRPAALKRLERLRPQLGAPIHRIGEIVAGRGVRLRDARGKLHRAASAGGYEHFKLA